MVSKVVANNYFDEAYFQRGSEKGTAYHDYASIASISASYKEIALAISEVFKPSRVLEIGCATGPIVKHLNDLNIEAYGIDVSSWAIQNRLHENVILAGADDLPFESGYFDLIVSCHALEHLPPELFEASMSEINRVLSSEGKHFHLLPIIGTYPYDYDKSIARRDLKKDPTHFILEEIEWWENKFKQFGFNRISEKLFINNDTSNVELSSGQMIFSKNKDENFFARLLEWNERKYRNLFINLKKAEENFALPKSINDKGRKSFLLPNKQNWSDASFYLPSVTDLSNAELILKCELDDTESSAFRIAVRTVNEVGHGVLDKWFNITRGISVISVKLKDLGQLDMAADIRYGYEILAGGNLSGVRLSILGDLKIDGRIVNLFDHLTNSS